MTFDKAFDQNCYLSELQLYLTSQAVSVLTYRPSRTGRGRRGPPSARRTP